MSAYSLDFNPNNSIYGLPYISTVLLGSDGWVEFEVKLAAASTSRTYIGRTNSSQQVLGVTSGGAIFFYVSTGTDLNFWGAGVPRNEWIIIRFTRSGGNITLGWKSVDPNGTAPTWVEQTFASTVSHSGGLRLGGTGYQAIADFKLARIERDDGISLTFDADDVANNTVTFSTGESYPLGDFFTTTDGSQWEPYTPPGGQGPTLTPIERTLLLEAILRAKVEQTRSLETTLREQVEGFSPLETSFRSEVSTTGTLSTSLRTQASQSYTLEARLYSRVDQSYEMDASFRAGVSTTYDLTTTLNGVQLTPISRVYTLETQLIGRVNQSKTLEATLRAKVERSQTFETSFLSSLFSTNTLETSIRSKVEKVSSLEATLRAKVEATSDLLTTFIGRVSSTYVLEARLEALVDWNAPAYKLSLTLTPEDKTIRLSLPTSDLSISLPLELPRIKL